MSVEHTSRQLKDKVYTLFENNEAFEELALEIFNFQYSNNSVYREYVDYLSVKPKHISASSQIPFLPISIFKTHEIKTGSWHSKSYFESSGTGQGTRSKHFYKDLDHYHRMTELCFRQSYNSFDSYDFLALLPSYLERDNASLIQMVKHFMDLSDSKNSGFFLDEFESLESKIELSENPFLIGVSFALLDFAKDKSIQKDMIVMETGGMKGRRKEETKMALHAKLKESLVSAEIHSEYGMTELFSQAYSKTNGRFNCPGSMKVFIRDITDPFKQLESDQIGALNIIDLANVDTCCFVATEDLAKIHPNDSFSIMGRISGSEQRGCNLLYAG